MMHHAAVAAHGGCCNTCAYMLRRVLCALLCRGPCPVSWRQWLDVFRKATPTFKQHALADPTVTPDTHRQACADKFEADFNAALDTLVEKGPKAEVPGHTAQPLSCLTLCDIRERCLRNAGFFDVFKAVKSQEDAAALQILPGLIAEVDAITDASARLGHALRGVFAGNIFDLGAAASAERYASGASGAHLFDDTRDKLLPRPWAVDDFDAVVSALSKGLYRNAILFVDNAGSDVVLGMLPLARELLKLGCEVVLTANEGPSINDILATELQELLVQARQMDEHVIGKALAGGKLSVVSSGNWLPVIDLSKVSHELADVSRDADLVILEGMGRGIETNLFAQLTCDCVKLGMVKHPEVAQCLNGRLYDCVCKFTPGQPLPEEDGTAATQLRVEA